MCELEEDRWVEILQLSREKLLNILKKNEHQDIGDNTQQPQAYETKSP